ncbi:MAG: TRAP transporter small permease [Rhizobiaceae bacterium]
MRRTILMVDRSFRYVAMLAIVVTMTLTSADALMRYLLNRPLRGSIEIITDYALPMIVFLAASHAYRHGGFIRVTVLRTVMPPRIQFGMDMFAQVVSGMIAVLFTYAAGIQAIAAWHDGALSNGVFEYSLWPAYWIVFLGLALMTLHVVADLSRVSSGQSGLLKEAEAV